MFELLGLVLFVSFIITVFGGTFTVDTFLDNMVAVRTFIHGISWYFAIISGLMVIFFAVIFQAFGGLTLFASLSTRMKSIGCVGGIFATSLTLFVIAFVVLGLIAAVFLPFSSYHTLELTKQLAEQWGPEGITNMEAFGQALIKLLIWGFFAA